MQMLNALLYFLNNKMVNLLGAVAIEGGLELLEEILQA